MYSSVNFDKWNESDELTWKNKPLLGLQQYSMNIFSIKTRRLAPGGTTWAWWGGVQTRAGHSLWAHSRSVNLHVPRYQRPRRRVRLQAFLSHAPVSDGGWHSLPGAQSMFQKLLGDNMPCVQSCFKSRRSIRQLVIFFWHQEGGRYGWNCGPRPKFICWDPNLQDLRTWPRVRIRSL